MKPKICRLGRTGLWAGYAPATNKIYRLKGSMPYKYVSNKHLGTMC